MKKIAIVTIYDEENYGNRLQNYAVYRYLSEMGFDCETIVIQKPQARKTTFKKTVKRILCETIVKNNEQNRINNFSKFTRSYIPTRKIAHDYDLGKLSQEYDFFVVGSDQVWNPCFGGFQNYFDEMFLTFAPREKRVCFSPSFGVSSIPAEWKKSFSDALDGFEEISVREKTGVKIVSELTGKTAICLPDPTLLFDADAWQKIAREPKEEGFVFTYFLGERPEELLPKNGKIVDIMDKTSGAYYKYNPSDFIGFIKKADVVYTDSFHACVFSILFGKPFCVLERRDGYNSMSSRIQSLLEEFGEEYSPNEPRMIQIDPVTRDLALARETEGYTAFYAKTIKYGGKIMQGSDLKSKAVSGFFWKICEGVAAQGVSFVVTIVLARLLMPEDYAPITLLSIFITIANIFISDGFCAALVQRRKADALDFSSVLIASIGFAIVIYGILFFAAPYVALF